MTRWLAELSDSRFEVRKRAFTAIKKYGLAVEKPLRQAMKQSLTPEARRSLKELVGRLEDGSPHWLGAMRGIEVLERIGTSKARRVLEELAKSSRVAPAIDAQAALQRLARRKIARDP